MAYRFSRPGEGQRAVGVALRNGDLTWNYNRAGGFIECISCALDERPGEALLTSLGDTAQTELDAGETFVPWGRYGCLVRRIKREIFDGRGRRAPLETEGRVPRPLLVQVWTIDPQDAGLVYVPEKSSAQLESAVLPIGVSWTLQKRGLFSPYRVLRVTAAPEDIAALPEGALACRAGGCRFVYPIPKNVLGQEIRFDGDTGVPLNVEAAPDAREFLTISRMDR